MSAYVHVHGMYAYIVSLLSCSICTGLINASESLFTYDDGLTAADFSFPAHVPVFTNLLNISEAARRACKNDTTCLFDATATDDLDVGRSSMSANQQLEQNRATAGGYNIMNAAACYSDGN